MTCQPSAAGKRANFKKHHVHVRTTRYFDFVMLSVLLPASATVPTIHNRIQYVHTIIPSRFVHNSYPYFFTSNFTRIDTDRYFNRNKIFSGDRFFSAGESSQFFYSQANHDRTSSTAKILSQGSRPVSFDKWAEEAKFTPIPVEVAIAPITDLFTSTNLVFSYFSRGVH